MERRLPVLSFVVAALLLVLVGCDSNDSGDDDLAARLDGSWQGETTEAPADDAPETMLLSASYRLAAGDGERVEGTLSGEVTIRRGENVVETAHFDGAPVMGSIEGRTVRLVMEVPFLPLLRKLTYEATLAAQADRLEGTATYVRERLPVEGSDPDTTAARLVLHKQSE